MIESMRLLLTVTLNPNQLRAHVEPIADLEAVESIILVADVAAPPMPKLVSVVPPAWLTRFCGRALAKLLTGLVVALRERPSWILGYNLVPHGINALLIGRLTRRPVLIHLIGGPVEWVGGGFRSDNAVLGRLPRSVPLLERLLVRLIRAADMVAVMGSSARDDLVDRGVPAERVVALPASVDVDRFALCRGPARYDLVTASQLIPRKRLGEFLRAVALLRLQRPGIRAAVAGTGPLLGDLAAEARRLGVEDAVDFLGFVADIERVYAGTRVFVLTSRAEGLSIAITEAMAAGVPVVATDVGEVRDVVTPGRTGFLYEVGDVDALVQRVGRLLDDERLRLDMGGAAAEVAAAVSSRQRVTELNRTILLGDAS
jgi:glycosyltransferase involved in cell wall biosynthesis